MILRAFLMEIGKLYSMFFCAQNFSFNFAVYYFMECWCDFSFCFIKKKIDELVILLNRLLIISYN